MCNYFCFCSNERECIIRTILIIAFSLFISSALAGYLPLLGAGRGGSGGVGSNFLLLSNGSSYLLLANGTDRLCLSSGC